MISTANDGVANRLVEAVTAVVQHLPKTSQDAALERFVQDLPKLLEKKPPEGEGQK